MSRFTTIVKEMGRSWVVVGRDKDNFLERVLFTSKKGRGEAVEWERSSKCEKAMEKSFSDYKEYMKEQE